MLKLTRKRSYIRMSPIYNMSDEGVFEKYRNPMYILCKIENRV